MMVTVKSVMEKLDGEPLLGSLRQLINSFEHHVRDVTTVEQAEDSILRMEENDRNFHKYEFIKNIRSLMEERVGKLIEDQIELCSVESGQDVVVRQITENIVKSREFHDMIQNLKGKVVAALNQLVQNFEEEFGSFRDSAQTSTTENVKKLCYSFSDGESSFGSSFNQSSFLIMSQAQKQLQEIAHNLDKKNPNARLEALTNLCHIPPQDIVGSEHWPLLKKGLVECLSDSDEKLANMGLKYCAKGFSATTPNTREMYSTLVEYLVMQFNSRKSNIPRLKNNLDTKKPEVQRLLKAIRLLNEFQVYIPTYWVRLSTKFLDELLESTLTLFSIHQSQLSSSTQMTPLHFVALLDPKAYWFVRWMQGSYSRMPLFQLLKKYRGMVDGAVRHCISYASSRYRPAGIKQLSEALALQTLDDKRRHSFIEAELDYIYFIHSTCMLTELLCYKDGQKFFPIKVKDRDEPVDIPQFLVCMINLIGDKLIPVNSTTPGLGIYDPRTLVTNMLKKLCASELNLGVCICNDEVMDALLVPIIQWLDDDTVSHGNVACDTALLQIADVISTIAESNQGRQFLMYGEKLDHSSKNGGAHVIARFARRALMNDLGDEETCGPSQAVIGAYVYICRQLYNNGEGLQFLYQYNLHDAIAKAWREALGDLERGGTPTPGKNSDSASTMKESHNAIMWEDTLRDNLLNFAGTTKGLLLLQLSGAMNECVSYMYTRYAKKLQVSKCEKFGYGYMLTQVAATSPGMVALQNTGFIEALVGDVWTVLEHGAEDLPLSSPKVWPTQPIDRVAHKPLISLLNLLSAYPAVYEALKDRKLPAKESYTLREIPVSIVELIDRLIVVDSQAKVQSLFDYEQSHTFGLRLLSVMVTCLDTYLLLNHQYKLQNMLLKFQSENVREGDPDIIIDMLSVERNYILVKTYLIGGPNERLIPARTLSTETSTPYPFPMVVKLPIPRDYSPNIAGRSSMKQDNELSKFLSDGKKSEHNQQWMEKCRKTFCQLLTTKPEQAKGNMIQELLEQVLPLLTERQTDVTFPQQEFSASDSSVKNQRLTPIQELGMELAVRYGIHLKLFSSSASATDKLSFLMKKVNLFLQQKRQKKLKTPLNYLKGNYPGSDWFACSVFLIMNGDRDRTWKFLHRFSSLAASAYLWPARLHNSVHLPTPMMSSGIPPLFSVTGYNVELLLQSENPIVYSAFKMSGYTPAQICQHWLRQCFWNYLDWVDICHYISICLVMGIDYQVYLCVAILKHLQPAIMQHMQTQELVIFLKEEPIRNFRVGQYLEFMQQLEQKYRQSVLKDMLDVSRP
ncbi:protein broad-minded-like [Tubulanus polymorphus]|uniref:protein broad-minded-like n=1 Tax=Tubulanus polymorphus TaxID=672921 RepID=UPI003DA36498